MLTAPAAPPVTEEKARPAGELSAEEILVSSRTVMLNDAHELGLSYLFDRMVIQVYSPLMFRVVDHLGHFPHYIYTFYAEGFNGTEEALRERLTFCRKNGIEGVTM